MRVSNEAHKLGVEVKRGQRTLKCPCWSSAYCERNRNKKWLLKTKWQNLLQHMIHRLWKPINKITRIRREFSSFWWPPHNMDQSISDENTQGTSVQETFRKKKHKPLSSTVWWVLWLLITTVFALTPMRSCVRVGVTLSLRCGN